MGQCLSNFPFSSNNNDLLSLKRYASEEDIKESLKLINKYCESSFHPSPEHIPKLIQSVENVSTLSDGLIDNITELPIGHNSLWKNQESLLQLLLNCLSEYALNYPVASQICNCIVNLSSNSHNNQKLIELGVSKVLLGTLLSGVETRHFNRVCAAIISLCIHSRPIMDPRNLNKKNKHNKNNINVYAVQSFYNCGIRSILLDALKHYSRNRRTRQSANPNQIFNNKLSNSKNEIDLECETLDNLLDLFINLINIDRDNSITDSNQRVWCELGICEILAWILRAYSKKIYNYPSEIIMFLRGLQACSCMNEFYNRFIELGIIERLTEYSNSNAGDYSIAGDLCDELVNNFNNLSIHNYLRNNYNNPIRIEMKVNNSSNNYNNTNNINNNNHNSINNININIDKPIANSETSVSYAAVAIQTGTINDSKNIMDNSDNTNGNNNNNNLTVNKSSAPRLTFSRSLFMRVCSPSIPDNNDINSNISSAKTNTSLQTLYSPTKPNTNPNSIQMSSVR